MARSGRPVRGWRGHSARFFVYASLVVAGLVVLIPFLFALSGSLKTAEDVFTYPPRALPRVAATSTVDEAELPLFTVPLAGGGTADLARVENGTSLREFRKVDDPDFILVSPKDALEATGTTVVVDGEDKEV